MYIDYNVLNEFFITKPQLAKLILDHVQVISFLNKSIEQYSYNEKLIWNSLKCANIIKDNEVTINNELHYENEIETEEMRCTSSQEWLISKEIDDL